MNQNKSGKLNTCETSQKEPIFSTTDIYVILHLICIARWSAVDLFPSQAILLDICGYIRQRISTEETASGPSVEI